MGTDLNKNGGMNISLVMRMDYSVQYIVSYRNENGRLLEIKEHSQPLAIYHSNINTNYTFIHIKSTGVFRMV